MRDRNPAPLPSQPDCCFDAPAKAIEPVAGKKTESVLRSLGFEPEIDLKALKSVPFDDSGSHGSIVQTMLNQ
jgi:hypothetical protein